MRKRDLIIVIVVIAVGLAINAIRSGKIDTNLRKSISKKYWELSDSNYLNEFKHDMIRLGNIDHLTISNFAGDINIQKSASDLNKNSIDTSDVSSQILIQPTIQVFHKSKDRAKEIYENIKIENIEKPNKSTFINSHLSESIVLDDSLIQRVRVHFKVIIPESQDMELDIKNRFGDININGYRKNISLDCKHGDITAKQITSPIHIKHRDGRLKLQDVSGKIDLTANHSRVRMINISELKLYSNLSKIVLNKVKNNVLIDYAGYSSINIEDGNRITVNARHSKINLKKIKDAIHIKNAHEAISMQDIQGAIQINANNCEINLANINSSDVIIKNAYDDISIKDLSSDNLHILLKNGDLNLSFNNIKEKINIKNKHSKIFIDYPQSIHPLFNLNVMNGKIDHKKIKEKVSVLKEGAMTKVLSAKWEGSPEINISTTYGDILLNKNWKHKY